MGMFTCLKYEKNTFICAARDTPEGHIKTGFIMNMKYHN